MTVRRGVTMVEALIAIFLTAIGLLAILVLFPLGAIKMAYAIQADRIDYAGAKASAIAEARDVRRDPVYYNPNGAAPAYPVQDLAVSNPTIGTLSGSSYDGPGIPLYVDPLGLAATMPNTIGTTGGTTSIARQNVSYVANVSDALKWFSLLDDIEFKNDGPFAGLAGSDAPNDNTISVNRTNKYSYAYMLRRPRYSDPSIIDMSVVVYEKRSIQAPSNEYVYPSSYPNPPAQPPYNSFDPINGSPNEVFLFYSSERPPIRRGGWLLDATVVPVDPANNNQPNMQGYLYRVADVLEVGSTPPSISVQLEQPLRGTSTNRTFVVMEGVVEVVERGPGWKP